MSCSHRSALFLQHAYRCTFVTLSVVVWTDPSGCTTIVHENAFTLLVGQYYILKIVLSQASWQRVMLLPSRSALQPLPSFNLLCRCKPSTSTFFISSLHIVFYFCQYIPFTYCVCWINRRGYCRPTRRWWRWG